MTDGHRNRRELFTSFVDSFRGRRKPARLAAPRRDPDALLRPPGALEPDDRFLEACTGCGDCVPVCPVECIVMVPDDSGRVLPSIDPSYRACQLCTNLPCISACPDGALEELDEPENVRIGIARVDPRRCVTFQGEACDACPRACPYPDRALMVIGGRPLVGSGACTGCGLCEAACPESPKAIEVVPERQLVPGLRVPRDQVYGR
jgi:ferredoxin-type protein NapG